MQQRQPSPKYGYPTMGTYMPPVPIMPICPMLARAYVPYQVYQTHYDLNEAMKKGTLYPDLYQPYRESAMKQLKGVEKA